MSKPFGVPAQARSRSRKKSGLDPPPVSDQRTRPSGDWLNRCRRGLCSVGGGSAMAAGEGRRNAAAADPQRKHFVIGKEIGKLNC